MCKQLNYILLFSFLFFSPAVFAQDDEYTVDTTIQIMTAPPYDDNDTDFFSSVIQTGTYKTTELPPQKVEDLKSSDDYWYANLEPEKKPEKKEEAASNNNSLFAKAWFRNLLWIIILTSFIAVVIWYLASSNIRLFRKASKKIMEEEAELEPGDDIHSINYEKEIQKAVNAGNYRLAVRLWYLRTLKELADRNIIEYRQQRTNSDYLASLAGGRFHNHFFRLTRNFEYTWYGQFPLSEEGYGMMRNDFSNFKNSLY